MVYSSMRADVRTVCSVAAKCRWTISEILKQAQLIARKLKE